MCGTFERLVFGNLLYCVISNDQYFIVVLGEQKKKKKMKLHLKIHVEF